MGCPPRAAAMAIVSSTGVSTRKSRARRAARHPSDMPRKQASRMVLVKKVKKRTWAGNQRIQASSRKRSNRLIKNNSTRVRNAGGTCCSGSKTMGALVLIRLAEFDLNEYLHSGKSA